MGGLRSQCRHSPSRPSAGIGAPSDRAGHVMDSRLRIVVSGLIAQYPLGGVTWDYLQYPCGLARLGHDVYYVEDTGKWPYNPQECGTGRDPRFNVDYLGAVMRAVGLASHWSYRFPGDGRWYGLPDARRREIVSSADLVLNVSGTLERPSDYRGRACLAYIDSDPVFTQLKLARGQQDFRRLVDAHDVHFSFGERIGETGLDCGYRWLPTRQPVVLPEWRAVEPPYEAFTTVMNWTSYKPLVHEGRTYGQKDLELERFLGLPELVRPTVLEIAVAEGKTRRVPRDLLRHRGWRVADPSVACPDPVAYRRYVAGSKAEFTVAKNGYVEGKPGWFSCRSACYLAAGRPVVAQETGFSAVLPVGAGLLSFSNLGEAAAAIASVKSDYRRHADAARELAAAYFDSKLVLGSLVERAMRGRMERRVSDTRVA
jgi:hypothetical protein